MLLKIIYTRLNCWEETNVSVCNVGNLCVENNFLGVGKCENKTILWNNLSTMSFDRNKQACACLSGHISLPFS